MTPTKKEIQKHAIELYMAEQHSIDFAFGDNLPEISELKEGGYWQRAKEQLRVSKIPDVIILHM